MKKYMLFVAVIMIFIIGVPLFAFVSFSENIKAFSAYGQAINAVVLAFLELLGMAIGIWLLHLYFRRRAQQRFVFEGFSNEAELLTAEQKPINLSKLALEELILQFQSLYNQLRSYTCPNEQSQDHRGLHNWLKQLKGDSFEREDIVLPISNTSDESASASIDILNYLPLEEEVQEQIELFKKALRRMLDSFGTTTSSELASSIMDVVPKGMASVIKFFDMLISPRIVKGIGYLQYGNDKIGITIEIIDQRKHSNVLLHTFWKNSRDIPSGQQGTNAKDMSWLVPYYIELLGPAMCWLVLQMWERKVEHYFSSWPFFRHRFFHWLMHDMDALKKQKAIPFYLLGVLYYGSAEQFDARFDAYKPFFFQTAASYLQKVAKNWWAPTCI